jgi:hypothetical protein
MVLDIVPIRSKWHSILFMRIAGYASIAISARYVHPSSETLEGSFDRVEIYNRERSAANTEVLQ